MPTLSQVHRPKPTETKVDLGDGVSLGIVFDANAVTPAWIDATDRKAKDENDVFALAAGLAAVIESWDLVEDDGVTPVPVTREQIGALSFGAVGALVDAVISVLPVEGGGKRLVRAFQHGAFGLHGAERDIPWWAGYFAIARKLGVPVTDVEDTPMFWVTAAGMMMEAEQAADRAAEARRN